MFAKYFSPQRSIVNAEINPRDSRQGLTPVKDIFKHFQSFDFDFPENAHKQIALSLYCPQKTEVEKEEFLNGSAYALIKRGGYIANPDNFDCLRVPYRCRHYCC